MSFNLSFKYIENYTSTNISDLKSLKDFMKDVVFSINGAEDDLDLLKKTVVVMLKYSCEYPVTVALHGRLALPATPWLAVARAT